MSYREDLGLIEFIILQKENICLNLTNQLTINNGFEIWSYRGLIICVILFSSARRQPETSTSSVQHYSTTTFQQAEILSWQRCEQRHEPKDYTKFGYFLGMNSHRITGFLDFFPSSGILETRKHDVSETGFVSVLRWKGGGENTYSVGPLERVNLNHWTLIFYSIRINSHEDSKLENYFSSCKTYYLNK
jgi:hypothetical protein